MLSKANLAKRRTVITGTDLAKILGLHPTEGKMSVFTDKMGLSEPVEENPAMRGGNLIEKILPRWYERETGLKVRKPRNTIIHPQRWYQGGTPDGMAYTRAPHVDLERVPEFKGVTRYMWWQWADGTPPDRHYLQDLWYQDLLDCHAGDIVAWLDVSERKIFPVEYDEELVMMCREEAERFMVDHVKAKKPPEPDGLPSTAPAIQRLHRLASFGMLDADENDEMAAYNLSVALQDEERASGEVELQKNHFKLRIGDYQGVKGSNWKITWKETKGRTSTDYKTIAQWLFDNYYGGGFLFDEIEAQHTTPGTPSRRFYMSGKLFKAEAET